MSEASLEKYKAELQQWIEERKYLHSHYVAQGVEMFAVGTWQAYLVFSRFVD